MSIKLMTKAWETPIKGEALLTLLALCDFANDEGACFPSLKTLGEKAKVAKTTLSYILKSFEKLNIITRTQRKRENNSDTSTLYKINHFNVTLAEYKAAYQEIRNYKPSSQCEHPKKEENNENVNTLSHNVNTQNAKCEHLEPSNLNHQDTNHHKNIQKDEGLKTKDIIDIYKERVSSLQRKIKEKETLHAIMLLDPNTRQLELGFIIIGIINYSKCLPEDKKYITNLAQFIEGKIYMDYQKEEQIADTSGAASTQSTCDIVDKIFTQQQRQEDDNKTIDVKAAS